MDRLIVALLRSGQDTYILAEMDNGAPMLTGFKNIADGLQYFERSYNQAHRRSYESSMSACINFVSFQPRITEFKSIQCILDVVEHDNGKARFHKLNSVSGHYTVLKCKHGKLIDKIYENAERPQLIAY